MASSKHQILRLSVRIATVSILISLWGLVSCYERPANSIKSELLKHYRQDTLKLKAALFLYENTKSGWSYGGENYEKYFTTIKANKENPETQADELRQLRINRGRLERQDDSLMISTDFIINWVDESFKIWEQAPWHDQVDFKTFCEYILPLKIDFESIEDWKNSAHIQIPDSIRLLEDMAKACYAFATISSKSFEGFRILYGENALELPPLPYSGLKDLRAGSCDDLTRYGVYSLRAQGFPISIDFTPHWANRSSGHVWCSLITSDSSCIPFNFPMDKWYPFLGNYKWEDRLESKVYRRTIEIDSGSHAIRKGRSDSRLPDMFNDPRITDVTEQYMDVAKVTIPAKFKEIDSNEKIAYISVFSRPSWFPVGWGEVKNDSIVFEKLIKGVLYLPVSISENRVIPLGDPFVALDSGISFFRPSLNNTQSINLTRKYPLFNNIRQFTAHMVDGKFQGANHSDFSDAVDLHVIKKDPGVYYQELEINSQVKFKYFRYMGAPMTWSNVGDIELYGGKNGEKLTNGEPIGFPGSLSTRGPAAAFDGDPVSFYEAKDWNFGWAGLAFDRSYQIERIKFIARTDYNIVVPGDKYELFYWDEKWVSLGKQTAYSYKLKYENVPTNALFWLRNLEHGNEERIFTIDAKGEQVWW